MKRFSRIFFYLRNQKGKIGLYLIFNVLSIAFSLVSVAMLAPFLKLLLSEETPVLVRPPFVFNSDGVMAQLKYGLSYLKINYGPLNTLAVVCVVIIMAILLKNLF